jgi:calcineurin-like phosphoesterase family protein
VDEEQRPAAEPEPASEPAGAADSDVPAGDAPAAGAEPPRSALRTTGLAAMAFIGTLIVLAGLALGFRGIASSNASGPSPTAAVAAEASQRPVATQAASGASAAAPSAQASAGTAVSPSPSGDPVLVGAGDIADCNLEGDSATATVVAGIAGTVFTAGDDAYETGSAEDFAKCYDPTWGQFKDRTRPAAGNHDWETKNAQGYRDYFGSAAVNDQGDTWYSYDLGQWHVIVLDADCADVGGCGKQSKQGKWLAADLAAHPATCTLAIWHQPRFSSGNRHGNDKEVDPFWRQLYAAGAEVVVNGHDHDYERFAPQTPDAKADPARGIREFVVGTGGAGLRGFDNPQPNSELRVSVTHGVLELTLHPKSYDWRWIPVKDNVAGDHGTGQCH